MTAGGSWSSYTYDPPFDTTLVNLPGIRDAQALALVEKFTVALRVRDLHAGDLTYPAYGDVESIRNLHLALYQDLYGHAGELRTVEVGVEHRDRVAPVGEIRPVLEAACGLANDPAWHRMDAADFAWRAAEVHALLEYAHPFVIGNGVTAREFLADVASIGPYTLDVTAWDRPSGPLALSAVTREADGGYRAHPGPAAALVIHRALAVDGEVLQVARYRPRPVLDPGGARRRRRPWLAAGVRGSAGGGGPVVARPGLGQAGPYRPRDQPMTTVSAVNAAIAVITTNHSNHSNRLVVSRGGDLVRAEGRWENVEVTSGLWRGGWVR